MAKKKVVKPQSKNISFSEDAHSKISSFCKERGLLIKVFCENAALGKMEDYKRKEAIDFKSKK